MTDAILTIGLSLGGLLVLCGLAALVVGGAVRWAWVGAAGLATVVHDVALTRGFGLIDRIPVIDADWNVSGKILSIIAVLVVALVFRLPQRELGLSVGAAPGARLGWVVCLLLVAVTITAAVVLPGDRAPWVDIAYQATLPGMAEELFYRGLLLALLMRAFAPAGGRLAVVVPAVLATLLFVLPHVALVSEGAVRLHPPGASTALIVGAILVWLRLRTGGLAAPILLHNVVNTAFRLL